MCVYGGGGSMIQIDSVEVTFVFIFRQERL